MKQEITAINHTVGRTYEAIGMLSILIITGFVLLIALNVKVGAMAETCQPSAVRVGK